MKLVAVALPALFLASAAGAQVDTTPTAADDAAATSGRSAQTQTETAEDPNRRVCRRVDTNTGSRVPHRLVCMTAAQWAAQRSRD